MLIAAARVVAEAETLVGEISDRLLENSSEADVQEVTSSVHWLVKAVTNTLMDKRDPAVES